MLKPYTNICDTMVDHNKHMGIILYNGWWYTDLPLCKNDGVKVSCDDDIPN